MVKNQKGGNKSKKMGRKFISAPVDRKIRLSQEEGEIYAVVTKNLGNGMFYANDCEGKERLCIMRRKFKGRGKNEKAYVLKCNDPNYKIEIGKNVLSIDERYYRPTEVDLLVGDPTKANKKLGWYAEYDLPMLVKDMMKSDLKLMTKDQYLDKGGYNRINYY